jgi:release factor glutamine methyltransferase
MPESTVPLASLVEEGARQLALSGVPEPRRQAQRLWRELGGPDAGSAPLEPGHPVTRELATEFRAAARRLAAGEPLAHVTGWTGFRHLLLRSDRRALIPRPETEGLIDLLLQRARTGFVADIGTGSGCIALSLVQEGSFGRVVGIDSSREALGLARLNAQESGLAARVDWVLGDLAAPLRAHTWDALISNPPYLSEGEYAALDASVREWEPHQALRSGADGLDATRRLIEDGYSVLRPGGWLALEIDSTRATAAARLATERSWSDVSIHLDLFGRERYLLARRSDTR